MDDNALDIILKLNDEMTPALLKAQQALRDAAGQIAATGGLGTSAFKGMEDSSQGFSASLVEGVPIIGQFIGALSAERIIEFSAELVESTARIADMAVAAGLSTTEFQKFAYVGQDFNLSSETMARAVEQLSARLAGGDASAASAVGMLGLNVKQLLAAGPAEAFLEIADATGRIQDPMMKNAIATDEFGGKLARILIPALADFRKKLDDVPQNALINQGTIDRANAFEVSLNHLKTTAEAYADSILFAWSQADIRLAAQAKAVKDCQDAWDKFGASTAGVLTNAQLLQNRLEQLRTDAVAPLTDAQKANIVELESYGISQTEIARLLQTSTVTIQAWEAGIKATADATRIMSEVEAEASAQLMTSYTSRIKILGDLQKATQQAYGLDAQIAALQQLDAMEQVEAVNVQHSITSEQDRAKVRADAAKQHIDILNQIAALRLKLAGQVNVAQLAEFDAQTTLNAAMGRDASGAILIQKSALDVLNQAMEALHQKKMDGISQSAQEQVLIDAYTKSLYDDAVAQDALTQSVSSNTAAIAANSAAKQQAASFSLAGSPTPSQFAGMSDATLQSMGYLDLLDRVTMAGAAAGLGTFGSGSVGGFAGTRDAGGPVMPGQSYLIGTGAQPELFTPSVPGTMTPSGSSGGATYNLTVNITHPLGTPTQIANAVNDSQTTLLKSLGVRLPGNS